MESAWKSATTGVRSRPAASPPAAGGGSSPAADYLDRCGALAAAAAAGLSGMMLATVTSPPTLAAFSSCALTSRSLPVFLHSLVLPYTTRIIIIIIMQRLTRRMSVIR